VWAGRPALLPLHKVTFLWNALEACGVGGAETVARGAPLSNAAPKQREAGAMTTLHGEDAFEHVLGRRGRRGPGKITGQLIQVYRSCRAQADSILAGIQDMPPRKRAVKKAYWSEEGRLASFANWPFGADVTCTAEKVHTPPNPHHARALSWLFGSTFL